MVVCTARNKLIASLKESLRKSLTVRNNLFIRKNNVADDDQTAIETAMRECVEEGCQIIFATSWGYMDACEALAEEYPDVIFSHATGYKSNGVNFNNYFGRIYQSRYLTGIAAGLKTESNKIGYVGAWGKDNAEVTGGCDAFAMGVYSVNPDATVYIKTTNSWYDPEGVYLTICLQQKIIFIATEQTIYCHEEWLTIGIRDIV